MTDLRVEPLSTDDAEAAGAVLSASHHNDPVLRVEFPDPQVRHRVLLGSRSPPPGMARSTAALWARVRMMTSLVLLCGNHLAGFH